MGIIKMEAMGMNEMGGSPFGMGNPFGASPFGVGNSFGGGMPSFMNESKSELGNDSFNIDDLVKKIDAKIAEIEKEEEENKNNQTDNEHIESGSVSLNDLVMETPDKDENIAIEKMYDSSTNDDDFFDDFFSDD